MQLINVKMPTIVGILTFMSRINHAQLSWVLKKVLYIQGLDQRFVGPNLGENCLQRLFRRMTKVALSMENVKLLNVYADLDLGSVTGSTDILPPLSSTTPSQLSRRTPQWLSEKYQEGRVSSTYNNSFWQNIIYLLHFYTPANFVCGGYTVFTLSVRVSVHACVRP